MSAYGTIRLFSGVPFLAIYSLPLLLPRSLCLKRHPESGGRCISALIRGRFSLGGSSILSPLLPVVDTYRIDTARDLRHPKFFLPQLCRLPFWARTS